MAGWSVHGSAPKNAPGTGSGHRIREINLRFLFWGVYSSEDA